jgi:hypothetical protein
MGKVIIFGMGGLVAIGLLFLLFLGGAIITRWAVKILRGVFNQDRKEEK